jgi:hypothetical protein
MSENQNEPKVLCKVPDDLLKRFKDDVSKLEEFKQAAIDKIVAAIREFRGHVQELESSNVTIWEALRAANPVLKADTQYALDITTADVFEFQTAPIMTSVAFADEESRSKFQGLSRVLEAGLENALAHKDVDTSPLSEDEMSKLVDALNSF